VHFITIPAAMTATCAGRGGTTYNVAMGRAAKAAFVVSLAVCVTVTGLWVLSFWFVPAIDACFAAGRIHQVAVYRGRAVLTGREESPVTFLHGPHDITEFVRQPLTQPGIRGAVEMTVDWDEAQTQGWRVGEEVDEFAGIRLFSSDYGYQEIMVSLGWILVPFSVIPIRVLLLKRRHAADCRCRRCGYNLTGNISGVCPECGTPVLRFDSPLENVRST
jgi:hypothetical protein